MTDEESKNIFTGKSQKDREADIRNDQRIQDTIDLANQQNMPLKSQPESLDRIIKPHMVRGSLYHLYHSKNMPISFSNESDGTLITLMERHKNLSLFMQQEGLVDETIVNHVNSVEEAWISWKRSTDGKTANLIGKNQYTITSIEEKPPEKGAFKPR